MFDEEAEQLEARRYQFVRNLVRQQHGEGTGGLLKMAEKESQVVVVPTKVFEFAAISGIEGTFILSMDYSSLMQSLIASFSNMFNYFLEIFLAKIGHSVEIP